MGTAGLGDAMPEQTRHGPVDMRYVIADRAPPVRPRRPRRPQPTWEEEDTFDLLGPEPEQRDTDGVVH